MIHALPKGNYGAYRPEQETGLLQNRLFRNFAYFLAGETTSFRDSSRYF